MRIWAVSRLVNRFLVKENIHMAINAVVYLYRDLFLGSYQGWLRSFAQKIAIYATENAYGEEERGMG